MGRYLSAASAVLFLFLLAEVAQLCLCANSTVHCIERERQALLKIKASLGAESVRLVSWKDDDCCHWDGIGCDNVTAHVVNLNLSRAIKRLTELAIFPNVSISGLSPISSLKNPYVRDYYKSWDPDKIEITDISGISELRSLEYLDMSHVDVGKAHNLFQVLNMLPSLSSIYLDYCGLAELHTPLVNLTFHPKLQVLSLVGNGLTVPFLNAFQNMTSLSHLDLSSNKLNNSLPSWFHELEKLKYLGLSSCGFHGPIPDALRNLTSIESLYLQENNFTSIPSCNLEKLKYLDLSSNGFHGPIPDALRNLTSIESLYLANNSFLSIPSWFCNFEKLVHLDLSFNGLRGPVPDVLQNMTSIKFLYFSQNNFSSIPSWFVDLKNLIALDLSRNELASMECSISSILGNMCHLERLDFSRNKLGGESVGRYELSTCIKYHLEYMDLSDNEFNDHLPIWLGQFENLYYLNLEGSSFYGTIPSSFGNLSKLQELYLSNNYLNGTIPQNLGQLVNLEYLDLSRNKLDGSIPSSFDQLVNLYKLDLSFNNLDGTISMGKEWSPIMSQFGYLNLSNNQISGSLPKNIGHVMPNLKQLHLGNNFINGSIPISLCQTQLYNLDLSKNKLSGEIPNCWKHNQEWVEINLSSNKLSGVFPSSIGNLSSLLWLHLNDNNLQGQLPISLDNLKQLLILDLGENQLSSTIPSWTVSTFPSLRILRLRQNMLNGSIPLHLCQLVKLKVLDLSRNNITGSIPGCIGNLTGMTLDKPSDKAITELAPTALSSDDPGWSEEEIKEVMKGRELVYKKILNLLVIMDLSENHLVGSIPNGITWLTGLHSLNLSNNHLKGEIPKMIGDMKSLESFDVSHNQLSGTIPNSMPALTSLSHLNLSYNNFSGPIPRDNQFPTYDPSSYTGNPNLFGLPLSNKRPGVDSHQVPGSKGFEDEDGRKDKLEDLWFYFVIAVGFAIGFWGVIGALLFKKSWRHAYFRWVEDATDQIYIAIVIKVAKLKKWIW